MSFSGCSKDDDKNNNGGGEEPVTTGNKVTITGLDEYNGKRLEVHIWSGYSYVAGGGTESSTITGGKCTVELQKAGSPDGWTGTGTFTIELQVWVSGAPNHEAQYAMTYEIVSAHTTIDLSLFINDDDDDDDDDDDYEGNVVTVTGLDEYNDLRLEVHIWSGYSYIAGGGTPSSKIVNGKCTIDLRAAGTPNPWTGTGTYKVELQIWRSGDANHLARYILAECEFNNDHITLDLSQFGEQ